MALALLDIVDADEKSVRFRVDVGTNTQYELRIGRDVREQDGDERVEDVYFKTAPKQVKDGDPLFDTGHEVSLPLKHLESGRSYAQLFSSKAGGKAQARSRPVPVTGAFTLKSENVPVRRAALTPVKRVAGLSLSAMEAHSMSAARVRYNPPRMIAHRAPLARAASLDDLIGQIVKFAQPVVTNLLKGAVSAKPADSGSGGGSGPMDMVTQILKSVLDAVTAPPAQKPADANAQQANTQQTNTQLPNPQQVNAQPTNTQQTGTDTAKANDAAEKASQAKSLSLGNRFSGGRAPRDPYSQAMVFGIDDALIGAAIGQLVAVLPQLANAANQRKLDIKKENDKFVGAIISDLNKRLMMEKLLEAQKTAQAQGPGAQLTPDQLKMLTDILAQVPSSDQAQTSEAKSLAISASPKMQELSKKAVLTFTFASQTEWNGEEKPVFDRSKTITLRPQFTVAEPAPKEPLRKAILKLALSDAGNASVRFEKEFKLKDVLANQPIACAIEPGELAHLPVNAPVSVVAELRWPNSRTRRVSRALGSAEIVLVNRFFVKSRGPETSVERELTDMTQYRPFWNKIWEAPVLDATRVSQDKKKYSWDLNVNTKYAVVVSPDHDSNGFMETKLLKEADDPQSVTAAVRGRMKAGIELSLSELNKLHALWPDTPALDADTLEALRAKPFIEQTAREFVTNLKLHGRSGEGGMVWVIPTFKLFGVTLSSVAAANDDGQVTATSEQNVQFPLPVAARLIGLKSAA